MLRDEEFQASLGYIVGSCLKKSTPPKKRKNRKTKKKKKKKGRARTSLSYVSRA
jgi:hypothetical protein